MKLLCIEDGIDSGDMAHLSKRQTPVTHNYRRDRVYEVNETELKRLAAIALFPEIFEYADEETARHVEDGPLNDELCDIVDARVLPFRKLTPAEEANDRLVDKTGEGTYTLPHGIIAMTRPRLVRKGRTLGDALAGKEDEFEQRSGEIKLQRKAPATSPVAPATSAAPAKKSGRKPMSAEARKAAGERLAAARAKKKAMKVPVGA